MSYEAKCLVTEDAVLAPSQRSGWTRYERVNPVPAELLAAYREIVAFSELIGAPRLVVVRSAGGAAGIYFGGSGVIVLGLEDVRDLALAVVDAEFGLLPLARRRRVFPAMFYLAAGRILAHEVGHAMDHAGLPVPYEDAEPAADFFAGCIDARRGKDRRLGALVFWETGCNKPQCSHPPSGARADAYCFGYDLEVATTIAWSA